MGLSRRKVRVDDPDGWVFNKMADVYDARPPYPPALIDAVAAFCDALGPRVCDLGAGTGHLALPLAQRGLSLIAVEPAHAMLARLRERARVQGLSVQTLHAAAERLPLEDASIDVAVIADALHFLDAELTGRELSRVLEARGGVALITCELADTPFMRSLVEVMSESAPRRPRRTEAHLRQLAAVAGVELCAPLCFQDHVPVHGEDLERILRSISFIGPAMNEARFQAFRRRVEALSAEPVWSRSFTLRLMPRLR